MTELTDTTAVAAHLKVDPSHVARLARQMGLGRKLGWSWVFTPREIRRMATRKGRRVRSKGSKC